MNSEFTIAGKCQQVLQDLESIYVGIEEITLDKEDADLLEYQLQEDRKLALRKNGIRSQDYRLAARDWRLN